MKKHSRGEPSGGTDYSTPEETIAAARRQLILAIGRVCPEAFGSLFAEVYPYWQGRFENAIRVSPDGVPAVELVEKTPGSEEGSHALESWAETFNLDLDWLVSYAEESMKISATTDSPFLMHAPLEAKRGPGKFQPTMLAIIWNPSEGIAGYGYNGEFEFDPDSEDLDVLSVKARFRIQQSSWVVDVPGDPAEREALNPGKSQLLQFSGPRLKVMPSIMKAVEEYIERTEQQCAASDLNKTPVLRQPEHFTWLAERLIKKTTWYQLAKAVRKKLEEASPKGARKPTMDESTIKRGVRKACEAAGIDPAKVGLPLKE